MRLVLFPQSRVDTAVHQLPEPDMVVDPRPNGWDSYGYEFKMTVKGTALKMTRTNPPENREHQDVRTGWRYPMKFRVYNSNEERYSFDSTKYINHGLEDERAPRDTTEIIIKDGIEAIGAGAVYRCNSLVKVTIPDSVKRIERDAFYGCESLRFIQLPPNLEYIREGAFADCSSLEAVFLPPTVKGIDSFAFLFCASLRILYNPDSVYIRTDSIDGCKSLLTDEIAKANLAEEIEWLRNRYNQFHKLCCQPSVTPQAITQHVQDNQNNEERARTNDRPQFTALHLLAANPSVTGDMITAYLQLAPDVAVMQDNIGMTPLHMLCSRPYFSNTSTRDAISSYLSFSDGKEAAFMIDKKGKSPLDYLYENDSVGLLALSVGGSFSYIMVWWYACMDMNLLVE